MSLLSWDSFPKSLFLSQNEVHVWKASFDSFYSLTSMFQLWLDQDELARANRYHFEKDRHHFILSRGILRSLLGIYLNCPPKNVHFTYNQHGKPALRDSNPLVFNVSHSRNLIVYAFAYQRELGIDIEYSKTDRNMQLVAKSFSHSEQAQLNVLNDAEYLTGFYRCWTRKEAYIKASGKGFSIPLKSFDVSVEEMQPCILKIDDEDGTAQEWKLINLPVPSDYAGTLAVRDHNWTPRFYQYHSDKIPKVDH